MDLDDIRPIKKPEIVIGEDLALLSVAELDLYPGREVTYSIKAAGVTIYPL